MREYIKINYGKLSHQSKRLSAMADGLKRCRVTIEKTENTLIDMKGAAADALTGRRIALLALIDELIEDIDESKHWLDKYEGDMRFILAPTDPSSDLVVDKREFAEFVQHLERQIATAYMPDHITPTSERYLAYHTRTDGLKSWTETTERYDLYQIEEGNGSVIDSLRGSGLIASKDNCLSIVSKIEQMGRNSIEPFFQTDAALAAKLPANIYVPNADEIKRFVDGWAAAYAALMSGERWDMGSIKELMSINPEVSEALLMKILFGGYAKGITNNCLFSKDPVNLSTGNFIYKHEDLSIAGLPPLSFERFYNVLDSKSGSLGESWVHNYEMRLLIHHGKLTLFSGDGKEEKYIREKDGYYISEHTGLGNIKIKNADSGEQHYEYETEKKLKHVFLETGVELYREDQNGNRISFDYDESGRLTKASTGVGSLSYVYGDTGLLESVNDYSGRTVKLSYEKGKLIKAGDPLGHSISYAYDEKGKMISVTDQMGTETVKNRFDESNRTIEQQFPDGGSMRYEYHEHDRKVVLTEQNGNRITHIYDDRYRTIKSIHANGEERFAYNEQDKKTLYVDKMGNQTTYVYDEKGNMIKVIDALGTEIAFTYTKDQKPEKIVVAGEEKIGNEYDEQGNLIRIVDALGRENIFTYNEKGQTTEVVQPDGSKLLFSYDERGNLNCITDPAGNSTVYTYDILNRVTETVDGNGNLTSYAYDDNHNIVKVVNADGNEKRFHYGENGKVTKIEDFNTGVTHIEYSVMNKPRKVVDSMGNTLLLDYDLMWNVKGRTNAKGEKTTFEYNRQNLLEKIVNPNGGIVRYGYDKNGNRTSIIGPSGEKFSYAYDALNRVTEQTEPNGGATSYTYNVHGKIAKITNALGRSISYEYDKAGQLVREVGITGIETKYTYTPLGQIEKISQTGQTTVYQYLPGGLLSSVDFGDGRKEIYTYDANKNIKTKLSADGYELNYKYDSLNRVIRIESNKGQAKTFTYDAMGNVLSMTDANGAVTKYQYDLIGNLSCVTDALGNITHYEYDAAGNPVAVGIMDGSETGLEEINEASDLNKKNRVLHTTRYEYDEMGQIAAVTDALGNRESYRYDLSGNLVERTDKDGYITAFDYDPSGEISKIHYGDGKEVSFSYDALRQLTEIEDWLGLTRIETDPFGRLASVTDHNGNKVEYETGDFGERKALTYPDGSKVSYTYDKQLRLTGLEGKDTKIRYLYDKVGRLAGKRYGNGIETDYLYTDAGQLAALVHRDGEGILDAYGYEYDAMGNKVAVQKNRRGLPDETGRFEYAYDLLGRLKQVSKDGNAFRFYGYDAFGNRTWKEEGGARTFYAYNALNQLKHMEEPGRKERYDYDRRGNLRQIYENDVLKQTYVFGALNRLEEAVNSEGIRAVYRYNGICKRIGKEIFGGIDSQKTLAPCVSPTSKIDYVLDLTRAYHNLLQKTENEIDQIYTWDSGILSASGAEGTSYYFHDELGSPIRLLDGSGKSSEVYGYDEFGQDLYGNHSGKQPFGFTGYQHDSVSGTYFAQAREYQAKIGRFMSEDMIHVTNNWFAYCANNPLTWVDLDGLMPTQPLESNGSNGEDSLSDSWNQIKDTLSTAWGGIQNALSTAWVGIKNAGEKIGDTVVGVWNNDIVGFEYIWTKPMNSEVKVSTIAYGGGNIFIPTVTKDLLTQQKTPGWKINFPAIPVNSINTTNSLVWSGNSFGISGSVRDTRTGVFHGSSVFFDSKGLNMSTVSGSKANGAGTMTTYTKQVLNYKSIAAIIAIEVMAVAIIALVADDATGFGVFDDAAIPGLAAAMVAVFVWGFNAENINGAVDCDKGGV